MMPAFKQVQSVHRYDPFSDTLHVLKIIGRLMPLIGAAPYHEPEPQTCLEITPMDGAHGPYLSIRLFLWRYRAQFAVTREELEALPITLLTVPSTPVILDDYAMFCMERLYDLQVSERPSFEYTEDERERLTGLHARFQLECIDAIVHRIHMSDVQSGYSPDIPHMTLRREVVWYARFIPWQRATEARLGERFLLAHVTDLYRTFRQQPHTAYRTPHTWYRDQNDTGDIMPALTSHVRLAGTHIRGTITGHSETGVYVLWEGSAGLPQEHAPQELESVEHYAKQPTPRAESTGEYDRHCQHSERLRGQMDWPDAPTGKTRGHPCTRK